MNTKKGSIAGKIGAAVILKRKPIGSVMMIVSLCLMPFLHGCKKSSTNGNNTTGAGSLYQTLVNSAGKTWTTDACINNTVGVVSLSYLSGNSVTINYVSGTPAPVVTEPWAVFNDGIHTNWVFTYDETGLEKDLSVAYHVKSYTSTSMVIDSISAGTLALLPSMSNLSFDSACVYSYSNVNIGCAVNVTWTLH